mmetsp:Transcript_28680/g.58724  ORF Transcript_28680/g.58724 Transcript_28680/m.58724 type:complete len:145 (-) Transcript_28680:70-504(-)
MKIAAILSLLPLFLGTKAELPSPIVTKISWGKLTVEGGDGTCSTFKDAKLYPGGARDWDWGETGTRHSPGIHPDDVDDLLSAGATTIVLSRGMNLRLKVRPETLEKLKDNDVKVEVMQSREAVARYNELAEGGEAVGALIHSTC